MKKIVLCFDIDGVICFSKGLDYKKSKPIKKNINKINTLFDSGFYIKLFTARFMGRSNENVKLATKRASTLTIKQLKSWGVKYHKVIFGKPTYHLFVDDRNIFHKSSWSNLIEKEIKKMQFWN